MGRILAFVVLGLGAFILPGWHQSVAAAESAVLADGAAAPPNTWHVAGGAASRSGHTLTQALVGPFEDAWSLEVEGQIEGEPLVWRDHMVFTEKRGQKRYLHVIRSRDRTPIDDPILIKGGVPLQACLWNRLVVVRSAERRLRIYRIREDEVKKIWEYRGTAELDGPLLYGHELYVREGGAITRLMPGLAKPVWRKGGSYRGVPSLYGRHIYALKRDQGSTLVAVLDRDTGDEIRAIQAGSFEAAGGRVSIGEHYILAHAYGGGAAGYFPRGPERPGARALSQHHFLAPPATQGDHFIAFTRTRDKGNCLLLAEPNEEKQGYHYYTLASNESHQRYMKHPAAVTLAGGIAYAGRFALRMEDREVLWRSSGPSPRRVIPTRDGLLLVHDKSLRALRRRGTRNVDRRPVFLTDHLDDPMRFEVEKGRALLDDGAEVRGTLQVNRLDDSFALVRKKKKKKGNPSYSLTRLTFMEDAEGRTLALPSAYRAPRLVRFLVEREMAGLYGELIRQAVKTNNAELLRGILGEAYLVGTPDKDLDRAYKKLVSLGTKKFKRKKKILQSVEQARTALPVTALDAVWARVGKLPEQPPADLRLAIARTFLEFRDTHAPARQAVRALVPGSIKLPEKFQPVEWADFLEAAQQVGVEFVTPDAGGTREQKLLAQYHADWRSDLVGVQSDGLLILAPPLNVGGMARCLSYGELLCHSLDDMFTGVLRVEKSQQRLLILLYETQEEYRKYLPGGATGHGLEWTAGIYAEGTSRMYLPAGEDEFLKVLPVFLHELTHHWVDERGPRLDGGTQWTGERGGYWIVEGFARFAEEFRFDPRLRVSSTDNPQSPCLDTVSSVDPSLLVDWKKLLELDSRGFHTRLDGEYKIKAPQGWVLGRHLLLSERSLFYDQGAALCHYLYHAEGGQHRALLLRFLQSFYSGKRVDLPRELKLSPEEIGAKVLDYARAHGDW